mgnify:CR=1 FL=1
MRWKLLFSLLLLSFFSDITLADKTSVKELIQSHFQGREIESFKKTPYLGLYEVTVSGEIFYTDEKANYFFFGHIIDTKTRKSLTSARLQEIKDARRITLDSLPLEFAIKTVKGTGARSLAVFTDPNCPYCKSLEKELVNITDVTIYTLLYPILNGSVQVATSIWCSADRLKAWDDFMLEGVAPTGKDCEAPIATLLKSGQINKVTGTPTLVFADGSIVGGMIPAANIEERLNNTVKNNR